MPRSHKERLSGGRGCLDWPPALKTTFHPEAVPALGSAGDVLIFDCRLDHTAAPNDSEDARMFVQVRYGAQWYADACRKNHAGSISIPATPPAPAVVGQPGVPPHSELPAEVLAEIPEVLWPRFNN